MSEDNIDGVSGERRSSASDLLVEFAESWAADRVRLADIVDVLKERAYGFLMLVFASPVLIPNPIPGVTTILGTPLVIIAAQLLLGRPQPWLPAIIGDRSVATEDFRRIIRQARPWLQKMERMLKQRMSAVFSPTGERVLAAVTLVMAIVLTLPIVFANFLPALAICMIALALIEFDGLMAIIGVVVAAISLVIALTVVYAFLQAVFYLLKQFILLLF